MKELTAKERISLRANSIQKKKDEEKRVAALPTPPSKIDRVPTTERNTIQTRDSVGSLPAQSDHTASRLNALRENDGKVDLANRQDVLSVVPGKMLTAPVDEKAAAERLQKKQRDSVLNQMQGNAPWRGGQDPTQGAMKMESPAQAMDRMKGTVGMKWDRASAEEVEKQLDEYRDQIAEMDPQRNPEEYRALAAKAQELASRLEAKRSGEYHTDRKSRIAELENAATQSKDFKAVVAAERETKDAAYLEQLLGYGRSKEQMDVALYYAATGQWDKVTEYKEAVQWDVNAARMAEHDVSAKAAAEKNPYLVGIPAAVAASFATPLAWLKNTVQLAKNNITGTYTPVDTNSAAFAGTHLASAATEGASKGAEWGVEVLGKDLGSFVVETGISIGQFLSKVPLGPLALGYMGAGAAGQTTYEALKNGASSGQAFALGTASGVIEAVTEKIGLDNLFDIAKNTGKSGVKRAIAKVLGDGAGANIISQMASEASEEVISEVANNLVDLAVMGEKSDFKQYVASLVAGGMAREQAEATAFKQFFVLNTLWAAAGGALSGGVMGGGSVAGMKILDVRTGKFYAATSTQIDAVVAGLNFQEGSQSRPMAENIRNRILSGGTVRASDIGALIRTMNAEQAQYGPKNAEAKAAVQQTIQDATAEANGTKAARVITPAAQVYMNAGVDVKTADTMGEIAIRVRDADPDLKPGQLAMLDLSNPVMRTAFTDVTGIEVGNVTTKSEGRKEAIRLWEEQVKLEEKRVETAKQVAEEYLAVQQKAAEQAQALAQRAQEQAAAAEAEAVAKQQEAVPEETAPAEQAAPDAATMGQAEFIAAYQAANPGASEAAAASAYADAQMQAAIPALSREGTNPATETAKNKTRRHSAGEVTPGRNVAEKADKTPQESSARKATPVQELTVAYLNNVLSKRKGAPRVVLSHDPDIGFGEYDAKTNTIYLNAELMNDGTAKYGQRVRTDQQALVYTCAHELIHAAKANGDAGIVDQLLAFAEKVTNKETVQEQVKQTRKRYVDFHTKLNVNAGMSPVAARLAAEDTCDEPGYIEEEVAADIMRDVFLSTGGLERMARYDSSLLMKLRRGVLNFLDAVAEKRGGKGLAAKIADSMHNELTDLVDRMDRALRSDKNGDKIAAENSERGVRSSAAELTEAEEAALLQYKSGDSYKINAKLRDGIELDEAEQRMVDELDRALEKLPKIEGTVYRTLNFDDVFYPKEEFEAFMALHMAGAPVLYKAYTSASTDIDGYPLSDGAEYGVIIEIASKNARDLEGFGNNFEKEALFPRKSSFIVRAVGIDASGYTRIQIEEDIEEHGETVYPEERGRAVRDVQETRAVHSDLRSVPETDPHGDSRREQNLPGAREEVVQRRYSVPEEADTNTPEFKRWFHDDSGELTNEDGSPKVFLRGDLYMGSTEFRDAMDTNSKGLFFSRDMGVAKNYAHFADRSNTTPAKEFKPRVVDSWSEAEEFVRDSLGERVRLEKEGRNWVLRTGVEGEQQWSDLRVYPGTKAGLAEFNADYDADLKSWWELEDYASENFPEGHAAEYLPDGAHILELTDKWQEIGRYTDSPAGLAKFNATYGQAMVENEVENPGWGRYYLSAKKTLVFDAEGRKWNNVDGGGTWTNDIAAQAWNDGYDLVVIKNVQDGSPELVGEFDETDNFTPTSQKPIDIYIAKKPTQVKSVYNTGEFNPRKKDVRYSADDTDSADAHGTRQIPWGEQVDLLKSNQLNDRLRSGWRDSTMYVAREATSLLQDIGLSDLPFVMTQRHARDIMTPRYDKNGRVINERFHDLTQPQMKRLPEMLANPVAIFAADPGRHRGGVWLLTDEVDSQEYPIFISIKPDQRVFTYDGAEGPAHFVNVFSRRNYPALLDNIYKNGDVLYQNSKKINALSSPVRALTNGHSQRFGVDFDVIIRQKDPTVKPGERKFSVDDTPLADTFFSKMEQEISAFKQAKMGASSVVAYLKGRGVKDEEIKWSGIEQWLEGKKSVTKEELLEFAKLNALDLEEQVLDGHREVGELQDQTTGEVYSDMEHMISVVYDMAEMAGYEPDDVRFDYSEFPDDGIIYAYIFKDGDETELTVVKANVSEKDAQWEEYATPGGENYREILYKMPGSDYSNQAMRVHWGEAGEGSGVLAHARVQDFQTETGTMLFIDEIQSDWHNAGQKSGYATKDLDALREELEAIRNAWRPTTDAEHERVAELEAKLYPKRTELTARKNALKAELSEDAALSSAVGKIAEARFDGNREYAENSISSARSSMYLADLHADGVRLTGEERSAVLDHISAVSAWNEDYQEYVMLGGKEAELNRAPEAPYAKTYHEYVLKRLIREAAAAGYDSIGWTTGKMQEERWSSEYAEGYRIEYDQDIPKFLSKYGKQWGAKVEKTRIKTNNWRPDVIADRERELLDYLERYERDRTDYAALGWPTEDHDDRIANIKRNLSELKGSEVWTMRLTDQMRHDVLYKGQPRYSAPEDTDIGADLNPDTGYARGSIADAIMQVMNAGDREGATALLREAADLVEQLEVEYRAAERDKKLKEALSPKLTRETVEQNKRDIDELIRRYGRMEQTSAAQQEVNLPRKIDRNTKVRGFAQTAMAAGITNEVVADELTQDILNGDAGLTYVPVGDKATLEKVRSDLDKRGFEALLHDWEAIVESDASVTKENIAMAEQLYVEACANKDVATAQKLVAQIAVMGTRAGQSVQAMTLLKKMTPSGQLYYLQKAVNRLNKEQKGRRKVELTIDPALARKLLDAKTREEIDSAMDSLIQHLADQLPVTVMDKWNAWRYLAMLGNPRTHVRNILGNVIFTPARLVKDVLAAGMEKALPQEQRTKSLAAGKELRDFAKQDADAMREELTGGGKYNPADLIRDRRKVFKAKPLAWAEKFNSDAMTAEDWWFLKAAYERSLAGFLAARGADVASLSGADSTPDGRRLLQEGRAYALKEAQKATYRDASKVAQTISQLKRSTGTVGSIFLDGVLPFTKTPINIVKRGVEYSPAGLLKGVGDMLTKVRRGEMTAAEGIDEICAGLTGTAVVVLGAFLASLGLLSGGQGDEDEDEFTALQGVQEYSLTVGDTNYTIDWMAPVALPLFVGAEIYSTLAGEREDMDADQALTAVVDGLATMVEPMLSLSMLDGLNQTLSANQYDSQDKALYNVAKTIVSSYFSQGVPTLLGQIARTLDDSRRTSFTPKGQGEVESWLSRTFQSSVLAKIPVAAEGRMLYLDAWGRADTESSMAMRALENFISPGYINTVKTTDVDAELMRLAGETKNTGVFPDKAQKYFTVDKETYAMTQKEYQAHLIERGQHSYELVSNIVHDPAYAGLDDATRAQAVELAYDYAASLAKVHTNAAYKPDKWMTELAALEDGGGDAAEYLLLRAQAKVSGESLTEVVLSNDDLAADVAAEYLFMETTLQKTIDEPGTSGYSFVLTDEQAEHYTELYREAFSAQFSRLCKSSKYRSGDLGDRKDMLSELKSGVGKSVREEMIAWLKKQGAKATKD